MNTCDIRVRAHLRQTIPPHLDESWRQSGERYQKLDPHPYHDNDTIGSLAGSQSLHWPHTGNRSASRFVHAFFDHALVVHGFSDCSFLNDLKEGNLRVRNKISLLHASKYTSVGAGKLEQVTHRPVSPNRWTCPRLWRTLFVLHVRIGRSEEWLDWSPVITSALSSMSGPSLSFGSAGSFWTSFSSAVFTNLYTTSVVLKTEELPSRGGVVVILV